MAHYYDIKYPFLQYPLRTPDGKGWLMCSIPVPILAHMYMKRMNDIPRSFFDCGAAIGELVHQATQIGMTATGIDIKRYPMKDDDVRKQYFNDGRIQIKNILDCAPIHADLAYCNGTLTYMNEHTLPHALNKFRDVKMLIAIHNTTEDVDAAAKMGSDLNCGTPRLIRSNDWWTQTFRKHGFDVDFDVACKCFCAIRRDKHK